jgi:glycosyltransferase involved in cell wall biosynthesis
MRLGVLTTHPVQYHAPWFRALAAEPGLELEVMYCHRATPTEQANAGFGVPFNWDTPVLEGYSFRFLRNRAANPEIGRFSGLDTPEIGEILDHERFDALLISGWHYKSAWQAMRACWDTGTPVMVRGDSNLRTTRAWWKRVVKFVPYRWFIRRLDACLAVGSWSREYFIRYGARPDRVFIVPHGVDGKFATEAAQLEVRRAELRDRYGLPQHATVFVFSGKLVQQKRPGDFINAIAAAAATGSHVAGLVVGDGPLRAECESRAAELQVPIRFAGFVNQSQIVEAYVASDFLVLGSSETWGLVVSEAMTCGRACIVSDEAGCGPDLIEPGKTGFIYRCGDVAALARIMCDCSRGALDSQAARQSVRERISQFSISTAVTGLTEALAAVRH